MEELFSWFNNIPFKNSILSGVVGSIITYIFTVLKMKKDRKLEFEKSVGSRIATSLYAVREAIEEANVQEIYDVDNAFKEGANNPELNDFGIYPAILNDHQTLVDFWEKINHVRIDHELYLSYKSSAYLLYMSGYLTKLIQFLNQFDQVDYHLIGTLLIFDLRSWQRSFDKQIVKEINKNKLKLTSKTGRKWEIEKKKINNEYWNKSFLKAIIEKIGSNPTNINTQINEFMFELLEKN